MDHKMSPEVAAERGQIVGTPYTPPGRTGTFDVPSYDDIADLQVLFKRFANTAASFSEAGGGPFVDKTGDFTVDKNGLYKTYLCLSTTLLTVTVPDPATLTDGDRFNLIQGSTGKAELSGPSVVGLSQTAGQYQGLTATVHDGKWWCVPFGSSGGGATGPIPVFSLAESVTIDETQAGGLLAMDSTGGNLQVTIPQTSTIPVGSAYVVSNVGSSSKNRVTIAQSQGVTILNRQSAVIERFRLASVVKQVDGATSGGNDVWLLNAGGGGGGSAVPLPPKLTACFGVSGGAALLWAPPEDDGGTPVTQYLIEQSSDQVDWKGVESTDAETLSVTIEDLTVGVTYYFRVKAANSNGISDPSIVGEAVPTEDFNDAIGGDVIKTFKKDGRSYRSHVFTSASGKFTVRKSVGPFQVMVVAGGGGGGNAGNYSGSGGGGAGGVIVKQMTLNVGELNVVVGNGGGGGANGQNSSFGDQIAIGGGAGGGVNGNGASGGSGGGGGGKHDDRQGAGGSGTPGQGNAGSSGGGGAQYQPGGGGGGAGVGGGLSAGGNGIVFPYFDGTDKYFGGGGGGGGAQYGAGGAGGLGGGGIGGQVGTNPGGAGQPNTGGGGGAGAGTNGPTIGPGPGGSGIVVVAYEVPEYNDASGGSVTTVDEGGKTYRLHQFTSSGTLTVTKNSQPFTIAMIGGGGGGAGNVDGFQTGPGSSGGYFTGNIEIPVGATQVTVGQGGGGSGGSIGGGWTYPGARGGSTTFLNYVAGGGAGSSGNDIAGSGNSQSTGPGPGVPGTAQGNPGGIEPDRAKWKLAANTGTGGAGSSNWQGSGGNGVAGAFVVKYEIAPLTGDDDE